MRFLGMLSFCAVLLIPSFAKAQNCSVPKVLIVLDKSSSMVRNQVNNETLWHWATQALSQLVTTFDGRIDFGLMMFPAPPGQCTAGQINVDVGAGSATDIISALGVAPPYSGNYTPSHQTLDLVASYSPLQDASSQNFVIFISDGWQWCDPYDPATRFLSVNSVTALKNLGIKTAVIGFYNSVDYLGLNRMAVEGQMPRTGCDTTATFDELQTNPNLRCYQQADNFSELTAALNAIATTITAEECNGLDDNCDGQIDEGLFRSCTTACGTGIEQCVAGAWTGCTAQSVRDEVCNDFDDDCDGEVDEGCSCQRGDTRPCGLDVGACELGQQICELGIWTECREAVWPVVETCNNVDDDCDGFTDNDLYEPCSTACGSGVRICSTGTWGDCTAKSPTAETCNAVDDDCNGQIDDGSSLCPDGEACIEGQCIAENDDPDGGTGDPKGTAPDGCSCTAGTAPTPGRALPFGLLLAAAFLMALRRRAAK